MYNYYGNYDWRYSLKDFMKDMNELDNKMKMITQFNKSKRNEYKPCKWYSLVYRR